MPNLIDKLTSKVDNVRQKAADKFGLPAHNMYRVLRTWSGGDIGSGTPTDVVTLITPTPKIEFEGGFRLDPNGLVDERKMKATGVSLTFTENFLQGDPKTSGQECFYKLVERNGQGADTTYWILNRVPTAMRNKVYWELDFSHYVVCPNG
jgi:hypothetical protein